MHIFKAVVIVLLGGGSLAPGALAAEPVAGGQIDGVVETRLINEAAQQYPGGIVYHVVPSATTVLVGMPDKTMRAVEYDPKTLKMKN